MAECLALFPFKIVFSFNIKETNKLFLNKLDRIVSIRVEEIHSNEELQGQDPNEFNAFRYLNKDSPATLVEQSYLIFGLGKHACPGRFFAINEIKVALHYLLLNYNIKKSRDKKIEHKLYGEHKLPSDEELIFEKKGVN